jgi:hypothetical protein
MATFNSPAVAVAVAAADVAAVGAVAVVVAVAVAVLAGAPAAHPGVRAAGAKRGHLPRVIDTNNNHGRVRHCRPGLCMCTSGIVRNALSAHRDHAEFPPH